MAEKEEYDIKEEKYLSWEEVKSLIGQIYDLVQHNQLDYVIGLPRGGLVPAVILSHKLSVPMMSLAEWKSMPWASSSSLKILLVDDIADKGETLKYNIGFFNYQNTVIATLHYKNRSKIVPSVYGRKVNDDVWLCYPWEQ